MASSPATATPAGPAGSAGEKSFFEQQRDQLRSEIALAMEHVLMNMNTLNRNMESIIAVRSPPPPFPLRRNLLTRVQVGREFESVEALWSQFEGVMGHNPGVAKQQPEQAADEERAEEPVDRERDADADADVTMG
jgi:hypothetical protein